MIAHLRGTLIDKDPRAVVIENGGVGYEVVVPLSTFYDLPEEKEEVSLHIHTHVREDALMLFGFRTRMEKTLFLLLVSVSGIGPRLAVNTLSGIGPDELLEAMSVGDAVRLQAIPGVGKKTAERIALELKDRAVSLKQEKTPAGTSFPGGGPLHDATAFEEAVSALVNLGYPARSARAAVEKASSRIGKAPLEGLIKESLRVLS
ncbi:MAG: Holliday junction branch migration protein RuvA [Desulfobacteraceae bacterium]|jgi:Holliday junction DNA helicase RuvA